MKIAPIFMLLVYMISLVAFSSLAAAKPSTYKSGTVYDCIARRNVPMWKLTDEEATDIILNCERWNKNKITPEIRAKAKKTKVSKTLTGKTYISKRARVTKAPVKSAPKIGVSNSKYLRTRDIAEAFGITELYDPIRKRMIPLNLLSRRRLIEYLNNPVSQEKTFGKKNLAAVHAKLEQLELADRASLSARHGKKSTAKSSNLIKRRQMERVGETSIVKKLGSNFERRTSR